MKRDFDKTLIQVEKKTAIRLKELKIAKLESYNEIICRLIEPKGDYNDR